MFSSNQALWRRGNNLALNSGVKFRLDQISAKFEFLCRCRQKGARRESRSPAPKPGATSGNGVHLHAAHEGSCKVLSTAKEETSKARCRASKVFVRVPGPRSSPGWESKIISPAKNYCPILATPISYNSKSTSNFRKI